MLQRLCNIPISGSFFMFGPRATGKTTLLKETFSPIKTHFIDLLNNEELDPLIERPNLLKEIILQLPPQIESIVLDEVQRAPALLDVVQSMMSQKKHQFILTGSSARKLKRGSANLLGGRAFVRHLWPLSLLEMASGCESSASLESLHLLCLEKMNWGGLPLVYLSKNDIARKEFLRSYVTTYINEEVTAEQLVRNVAPFKKFLQVAAQMSGKIINYSKIASDIGSSHVTVQNYFEILEDTLIGFALTAYDTSVRKRVRSRSKFYLFDVGVSRAISKSLESNLHPGTSYFGEVFEQMIITEFKALADYLRPDWTLHYLQTTHGAEIDLVIDTGVGEPILVEIKSATRMDKVDMAGTLNLMSEFPKSQKYVLSQDPVSRKTEGHISYLHWHKGLREIFEI